MCRILWICCWHANILRVTVNFRWTCSKQRHNFLCKFILAEAPWWQWFYPGVLDQNRHLPVHSNLCIRLHAFQLPEVSPLFESLTDVNKALHLPAHNASFIIFVLLTAFDFLLFGCFSSMCQIYRPSRPSLVLCTSIKATCCWNGVLWLVLSHYVSYL